MKKITVTIDPDGYEKVQRLLTNPMTGRVRYGSLSDLISRLLLDWAMKEIAARKDLSK